MMPIFVTSLLGYLLGSIPFGYLLVRSFHGADVRSTGSGNIGATNVARTSPLLGILTLLLDALKGTAAVLVAMPVGRSQMLGWPDHSWLHVPAMLATRATLAALLAVVGHAFPIWLAFRGGKGVATALGAFFLLAPRAMLLSLAVFLLVALLSRHVSLGSILAATVFPFWLWLLDGRRFPPPAILLAVLVSALIIARHHKNIGRLLAGTEPRFELRWK